MRIAIIDLGTNSVRFDIHQLGPGGQITRLYREKVMVRLGEGVFITGRLNRSSVRRTLLTFIRFKQLITQFRVNRVLALGTSALRKAEDRGKFQRLIYDRCGIDLKVISGKEEAHLIALGILTHEKIPKSLFALIDIGGGSTEISVCQGKRILHSHSFALGTARLQQIFLKKSPPDLEEIERLKASIAKSILKKMTNEFWPKVDLVIGSSGTIRAIAKMINKTSKKAEVERSKLSSLVKKMSTLDLSHLLKIPFMEPKRVDMILGGGLLLEGCMKALGAKKLRPTLFSLRDGIIERERQRFHKTNPCHFGSHLSLLYDQAKLFGRDDKYLRHTVKIASVLFDTLEPVHQMKKEWCHYLIAASMLRDTGQMISFQNHGKHSYYIIKNSNIPSTKSWENEFIARLCYYHDFDKISSKDMEFIQGAEKKQAFRKLLAILKLADLFDWHPGLRIRFLGAQIRKTSIELRVNGGQAPEVQRLYAQLKDKYVERTFRCSIKIITLQK